MQAMATNATPTYQIDKWGIPEHPAFKLMKMLPARRRVLVWLAQNEPIEYEEGKDFGSRYPCIAPGWLAEQIGLEAKQSAIASLFRSLESDGLIERVVKGKQTKRIALTPEWRDLLSDLRDWPGPDPKPEPEPREDPVRKLRAVSLGPNATLTVQKIEEDAALDEATGADVLSEGERAALRGDPWPEEVATAKPDLSGFGFTTEQINHVAHALLSQAVEAINTAREAAVNDGGLVDHLEHRVSELLEDNTRLRRRLDESRDYNKALHLQLDAAKRERTQLQITADALVKQFKKMPPPTDEIVLRELDRLMRQVPRAKG